MKSRQFHASTALTMEKNSLDSRSGDSRTGLDVMSNTKITVPIRNRTHIVQPVTSHLTELCQLTIIVSGEYVGA
jgi:hypothetical protein